MIYFWIYFSVLTAALAVYYPVVIAMDLHGKKKKDSDGSSEEFSTQDLLGSQDTSFVSETYDGFLVGGENLPEEDLSFDNNLDDDDIVMDDGDLYFPGVDIPDGGAEEDSEDFPSDSGDYHEDNGYQETLTAYERAMAAREGLEPAVPDYEHDYDSDTYDVLVSQSLNHQLKIVHEIIKY